MRRRCSCCCVSYGVKIKLPVIWKISFTDIFANVVSCITSVIKAFCRGGRIKSWPHAPLNTPDARSIIRKRKRHDIKRHVYRVFYRLLCENIDRKKNIYWKSMDSDTSNILYFKNIYLVKVNNTYTFLNFLLYHFITFIRENKLKTQSDIFLIELHFQIIPRFKF